MTTEEAATRAEAWLRAHGYTQWSDGAWQYNGDEVEAVSLLTEFILTEGKLLDVYNY